MKQIFFLLLFSFQLLAEELPKNIKWITNEDDPIFASEKAVRGGMFKEYMLSFPMTLRTVGPDSNGAFRNYILSNQLSLLELHPNTRNWIPSIATHWAYDKDNKTIYYKIDKRARWSDGVPVTADDFIYTLEFMRSSHIVAPWYNNFYSEWYDKVIKYDDHTIAVVGKKPLSTFERHEKYNLTPTPKHFYGELNSNFVKEYNWKIAPNTGPYQIGDVRKGKYIVLKRDHNWWANDLKYYKYRYNVDKIHVKVVRDMNVAYRHFLRGNIDSFHIILPDWWHRRATGKEYDNGYIHKIWFYNDAPASNIGIWLNTEKEPLDNIDVRMGFAHAMNIDKVIKTVLRNDYLRLQNPDEGKGPWTNQKVKAREFDLKKAGEYFDKAGFTEWGDDGIRMNRNGKRLSFKVTYGQKHHNDRLVIVKEEARKAGLELVLNLMDGAAAFKAISEKQHEVAWAGLSTGLLPDYWQLYHSANAHKPQTNNFSNANDKELDRLIEAFDSEFDDKKKIEYAHKIQQRIHDLAYFIPTFNVPYTREAYWRYWEFPEVPGTSLTDVMFEHFGGYGGIFWLNQEKKKETKKAIREEKNFPTTTIINKTFKPKL